MNCKILRQNNKLKLLIHKDILEYLDDVFFVIDGNPLENEEKLYNVEEYQEYGDFHIQDYNSLRLIQKMVNVLDPKEDSKNLEIDTEWKEV